MTRILGADRGVASSTGDAPYWSRSFEVESVAGEGVPLFTGVLVHGLEGARTKRYGTCVL